MFSDCTGGVTLWLPFMLLTFDISVLYSSHKGGTPLKTILIVDDDIHIGNALEEALRQEGYGVLRAYSGTEAIMVLDRSKPDLVLLDLMLPGLNGEEVLPLIQGRPVIVLSAKGELENKVQLLQGGAADYVTKPFHTEELLARIAAQLRTYETAANRDILSFGDIRLSDDVHTAYVNGQELHLTPTEYAILKILVQNQSRIVPRSVLLDRIGEQTPDCTESSLKTHISHLRAKLAEAGGQDSIETVWGIGFRMKKG